MKKPRIFYIDEMTGTASLAEESRYTTIAIEIEKPKCEHTVSSSKLGDGPWVFAPDEDGGFYCGKCGVSLIPTEWKEVE